MSSFNPIREFGIYPVSQSFPEKQDNRLYTHVCMHAYTHTRIYGRELVHVTVETGRSHNLQGDPEEPMV